MIEADISRFESDEGIAQMVKAGDFIVPSYVTGVSKFLRDNQSSMGDEWVKTVASWLYNFKGYTPEGNVIGSSSYMLTAIQMFCPEISLITGKQLLELYKHAGNTNPFGATYIDFGIQVNGESGFNPVQAKALLENYKQQGIVQKNDFVLPNYNQLMLVPDKDAGLVFNLAKGIQQKDLAVVSDYPFDKSVKGDGLFRAYLYWNDEFYACIDNLEYANQNGRVIDYRSKNSMPQNDGKNDLVRTLTNEFTKNY